MTIFNSLGSNYDINFVLKTLIATNKNSSRQNLKIFLENRYQGKAFLFYKGREALETALKRLNLPKKSKIGINGFTCFAVYEAVVNAGYQVSYLDIDRESLNFSSENLIKNIKKEKIKAVIVQNTLGFPCEIEKIKKICQENDIFLIEDLAHSIGAKYSNGTEVGTIGDFTVLSFSQDKMIDAVSGGAMIIRNKNYQKNNIDKLQKNKFRQELKDRFYPLFTFKIRKTYSIKIGKVLHFLLKKSNLLSKPMDSSGKLIGLSSWHCNLILNEFNNLEKILEHRKKISNIYKNNIDKNLFSEEITKNIHLSSNLRFPIFVKNRKSLINHLRQKGVYISDIWYDAPIAPKRYLNLTDYKNQCPNSEEISSKIVNLPTHINISGKDALCVSKEINKWLKLQ